MGAYSGPEIVNDGIVLCLDAGNPQSYAGTDLEVEYLIVAGGGGGGGSPHGAGGGAGGLIAGKQSVSNSSHSIVVGSGGAGKIGEFSSPWPPTGTNFGSNGSDSTAFGLTAIGGGGGGGYSGGSGADTVGKSGGSGGGTGRDPSSVGQAQQPGSASGGFGNAGGRGGYSFASSGSRNVAGGGGGAGEQAYLRDSLIESLMGRGGDGLSSSITGSKTFYAGGGGGSNYQSTTAETHPPGGVGGGGVGDSYTTPLNSSQRSGAANTGGGGGGAERNPSGDATGGSGGSGVVIVRYRGPQKATGGDSIYEQDGYTVHVFNNSANFVVGSTAGDISYNENAGVLNNGATFNSANGGSFDFDGTDDHIEIPSIGSALLEYSFSFFIKWNSITASGSRCFGLPTYGTYTILNSSDVGYHYNPLGGVPASTTISSGVNAGLNNWVHVCVTESRTNSQAKIYINGVEKGNSNLVSSSGFVGNITLGGQHKPSPNNLNADCNISLFLVYNKVLTAAEVAQNFAATRGRFGI